MFHGECAECRAAWLQYYKFTAWLQYHKLTAWLQYHRRTMGTTDAEYAAAEEHAARIRDAKEGFE